MRAVRREASVLHLDLDAFFASVEQRDKPSLRGKPVVVGGLGQRGVVATASYEARVFGVRSAMPTHEARRRCPQAAFLVGRFGAYHAASRQVMGVLRGLSPLVEPLSMDEAFVDLRAAPTAIDFSRPGLQMLIKQLKDDVRGATDGLTASVGVATSKFIAKVATELAKPNGWSIIEAGEELELLRPMQVGVIPGVGPVTQQKLHRIGIHTVADLQLCAFDELAQVIGKTYAQALIDLAHARDDRPVEPDRETKSISVEDTFETDLVSRPELSAILLRDARQVAARLRVAGLFAHTVTIKVRLHDFSTMTRSRTLLNATEDAEVIGSVATSLLSGVEVAGGVRLLGVGVAGLTDVLQEDLFTSDSSAVQPSEEAVDEQAKPDDQPARQGWPPGVDVDHDQHGRGWVWGSGLGRVTVRFETKDTPPGPVRTFAVDDPGLHRVDLI
ncbi:MAG TPA: DNA polymerase IV [Propionibacteriaceae bacterium]|nr:DNA polymerase IV [Propionibacteriaceae bacterium]